MCNVIKSLQCNDVATYYVMPNANTIPNFTPDEILLQNDDIIKNAYEKAEKIIEEAKTYSQNYFEQEAEKFNLECSSEKENAKINGYEQGHSEGFTAGKEIGYKDGYQNGLNKALETNQKIIDSLLSVIKNIETERNNIIEKQEENLTALSINIAETILNKTLKEDKYSICSIISGALEEFSNQEWFNCYLSKDLLDDLAENNIELLDNLKKFSNGVRFIPSKELNETDCIIELPTEIIDISVDTQLNKIKNVLKR